MLNASLLARNGERFQKRCISAPWQHYYTHNSIYVDSDIHTHIKIVVRSVIPGFIVIAAILIIIVFISFSCKQSML
jgi:hypothetical protein